MTDEVVKIADTCETESCHGQLALLSVYDLLNMRKKKKKVSARNKSAEMVSVNNTYTQSSRLEAASEHGFRRCFGRERLSEQEVTDIHTLIVSL